MVEISNTTPSHPLQYPNRQFCTVVPDIRANRDETNFQLYSTFGELKLLSRCPRTRVGNTGRIFLPRASSQRLWLRSLVLQKVSAKLHPVALFGVASSSFEEKHPPRPFYCSGMTSPPLQQTPSTGYQINLIINLLVVKQLEE